MSDLGTVASVEGWVGAEVPVDDCGIAATVEGAPPGVAVPDVVPVVGCCWPAACVGRFDRSTSTLRSTSESDDKMSKPLGQLRRLGQSFLILSTDILLENVGGFSDIHRLTIIFGSVVH